MKNNDLLSHELAKDLRFAAITAIFGAFYSFWYLPGILLLISGWLAVFFTSLWLILRVILFIKKIDH